jgi:uracil-DNA glycosylase
MVISIDTITYLGQQLQRLGNRFLKPDTCKGCPFYDKGKYYTPDIINNPNSSVFFLAQNPGEDEESGQWTLPGSSYKNKIFRPVNPQPLIGATGQLFNNRFLPLSGLRREEINIGNALRCRPGLALGLKDSNSLPSLTKTMKLESSKADIVKALNHCRDNHFRPPNSTKLIVTMGRYAMFALTGIQKEDTEYGQKQGVMESWRGYGVDAPSFDSISTINTTTYHHFNTDRRIFFTMHLAALFRGEQNARFIHATLLDFAKIKRIREGTWPDSLPQWSNVPPLTWPKHSAFDTEYIPELNDQLVRWSLCDNQYNLYGIEAVDTPNQRIPIEPNSVVLAQNWLADIGHFRHIVDISHVRLEDLMLADSVLYTGEPHNLNYIMSKYGSLNRTKHLSEDDPGLYSVIDAHQPLYMWMNHYIPQFKQDPASWKVYRQIMMRHLFVIEKAEKMGSPVDTNRLLEVKETLEARIQRYQEEARELTGIDKFNLGGRKGMLEVLYD